MLTKEEAREKLGIKGDGYDTFFSALINDEKAIDILKNKRKVGLHFWSVRYCGGDDDPEKHLLRRYYVSEGISLIYYEDEKTRKVDLCNIQ